jgi:hypothetical protein
MSESNSNARTPRAATTRDTETRSARRRRTPASVFMGVMYFPPELIPKDKVYAWIGESCLGEPTPNLVMQRMMNGWEPVPTSRHPEFTFPTMPGYENAPNNIFRIPGLILMECPKVFYEENKKMLEEETRKMTSGIHPYINEGTSAIPRFVEQNQTTFTHS